jgi:hypothetical protein
MFHQLCEEIFKDWKSGRLQVSQAAQQAFELQYCPEPYLTFRDQTAPITFVTLNPGGGEYFQRRDNIGTSRSPIRADAPYRETAADLGSWYASPSCPITRAAKTRIRAMLELGSSLGRTGVEQVECMPFHSAEAINGHRINDPLLLQYKQALSRYIESRDFVCAMAGGRADDSGVRRMAPIIGLDWSRRHGLSLTEKNGGSTSGMVFSKCDGRVRQCSTARAVSACLVGTISRTFGVPCSDNNRINLGTRGPRERRAGQARGP